MEYITTISSKGQITLPASIRRSLNVRAGDRLKVVKRDKKIEIIPDTYEQELAELRAKIEKKLKANGTWGMPWEKARAGAYEEMAKEYGKKHGLRS